MGYFKMKHVPASVSVSIADWLRKHGHAVRPALTKAERAQLAECFALMDGDGSGAIDVDELSQAFHVLGLHVTKQAVRDLVARVDSDGSGEVELPEFIQIMTMTREAEQEATFWGDRTPRKHSQGDEAVPLHYLTAAYRRKRTVDAIMDPELRQVYIDSPVPANNSTATAAAAAAAEEQPAMDLSATFRQSMRFNVQENADLGTVGTLFRSLAVDTFTPEPDDEDLYNPLTCNDRQMRRTQIEEAVRARFAAEEADLQHVIEQRRWMSPSGRTKRKGQPPKKQARSAGRRVALSPPPAADMTACRSSKRERAASPLKQPAELADDNMQDESNMMSVTMLLRRSPELDVATLGHMHLISSNTLRLSATPPSRCGSPDHVASNTTHPVHKEVVSTRLVPKGRNTVVPHVVHLRDLQSLGGNADVSADSGGKEFEGVRRTMRGGQVWDLTQYGNTNGHSTAKHAQQGLTQRAQHGVGDAVSASFRITQSRVADAQSSKHAVVSCMSDTAADRETFDLYQFSQTLTMQPLAGLQKMQSNGRGESPNGARSLPQGSCSMQSPALDSYEAVAAAVGAAESQGSFSIQPPALDLPLSHKVSSVRFTMDRAFSPDTGTHDDSSQGAGASPELMRTVNDPSVDDRDMSIGLERSSSSSSPAGTIAVSAVNRTISSVSINSSLKSALKQHVSNASSAAAGLSRGSSTLKGSVSGVSFALDGGDSSTDKEADSAQDDALIKQGSGSFPSWLTDGDDEALVQPQLSSLGAEQLTQDEDEQQEQAAPQSDSIWSSRDFHMSPKQGMQNTKGVKGDAATQFASLSFVEKRSRMISHPTAVQINARLLAIRQVAECC